MSTTVETQTDLVLDMTRRFDASPQAVYRAWLDPEALMEWFPPGAWRMDPPRVDARVGGGFRFEMSNPDEGISTVMHGEYLELVEFEKLVYRSTVEFPDGMTFSTVITATLVAEGDGTEVQLHQELFPSKDMRDKWQEGWGSCFDQLGGLLG